MSDAYALAAVTAVLRLRLKRHLVRAQVSSVLGTVEVSAVPPDTLFPQGSEEKTQLNLFLHALSPNTGWQQEGLPTRNGSGARVAAPPLPLNLHYVLTAFGKQPYHAEILLGHALQCLHEEPLLTPAMIEATLDPTPPDASIPDAVKDAGLSKQIERIKLSPERQSSEESSRFWSALQSSYRLSTGFQASVVLIESSRSIEQALPVKTRGITASAITNPVIESVESAVGALVAIDATSTLVIRGTQLRGGVTTVVLGELEHTPPSADVGDEEIRLPLASLANMPRAGARGVQVFHHEELGEPPAPHRVFRSNVGAFLLRPRITLGAQNETVQSVGGVVQAAGSLAVQFDPPVGREQRVYLVLNERVQPPDPGRASHAYRFAAPKDNGILNADPETAAITFAYEGVVQGDYLLRVQVDGAASELALDAQGVYASPQRSFG